MGKFDVSNLYIILPVHNRIKITERFIDCLSRQTFKNYKLILIDDGSTDGTADMVSKRISNCIILRGEGNWWWGGSLEKGRKWLEDQSVAPDALILIINDDVAVEDNYLQQGIDLMKSRKGCLLLSQYKSDNGKISESGVHFDLSKITFQPAKNSHHINCLSTRGLFLYWSDFELIGGFYPKLLPHYLSDYEFTIRAHRKGLKCQTDPKLYLVQNEETTGYHKIEEISFLKFLKKFFSKRSTNNPIYWTVFIFLVADRKFLLKNLYWFWKNSIHVVMQAYRSSRTQ